MFFYLFAILKDCVIDYRALCLYKKCLVSFVREDKS